MDMIDIDFDILILSEIWTHNITFYENIFDGYSFYSDLPLTSSIGGVGMYIKNDLSCKPRTDLLLTSTTDNKIENLWFEIVKNKVKYLIGGIYRHPNQNIKEFSELLESKLKVISNRNIPCFIAGDINIDFIKAETNKNT